MEIYQACEAELHRFEWIERLRHGQVAVFPTDTIYGFTADASNQQAVERILTLKERRTPLSCIPHDLNWARSLVAESSRPLFAQHIRSYFGRYTTLWPTQDGERKLHPLVQTEDLVGLRFPDHWIREFAAEAAFPLVTTSVNRSGKEPMRCLETLDPELREGIDFLVYEGPLDNPPSIIVRCDTPEFLRQVRR